MKGHGEFDKFLDCYRSGETPAEWQRKVMGEFSRDSPDDFVIVIRRCGEDASLVCAISKASTRIDREGERYVIVATGEEASMTTGEWIAIARALGQFAARAGSYPDPLGTQPPHTEAYLRAFTESMKGGLVVEDEILAMEAAHAERRDSEDAASDPNTLDALLDAFSRANREWTIYRGASDKPLTLGGQPVEDGVPCGHPGCLSDTTHICAWCGRVGGVSAKDVDADR
jgi:hypothetical protein